ncbi:hypothetical protein SAMN00808754_1163 [Thermanaeromonas toyohensis ToBE]|uniref:Uncharacterized protein n=1 Tax=Thermanaeromonas toyohensis ToBE TaxID=698762 RepID=A0A1W1VNU9_9FIRM|nr:hypothetical protein SAMN00808754_1163 [Thermanaeromonas toyohensis ToBE]
MSKIPLLKPGNRIYQLLPYKKAYVVGKEGIFLIEVKTVEEVIKNYKNSHLSGPRAGG